MLFRFWWVVKDSYDLVLVRVRRIRLLLVPPQITTMREKLMTVSTSLTLARLLSAILVSVCTKYCELHDVASSPAATTPTAQIQGDAKKQAIF